MAIYKIHVIKVATIGSLQINVISIVVVWQLRKFLVLKLLPYGSLQIHIVSVVVVGQLMKLIFLKVAAIWEITNLCY